MLSTFSGRMQVFNEPQKFKEGRFGITLLRRFDAPVDPPINDGLVELPGQDCLDDNLVVKVSSPVGERGHLIPRSELGINREQTLGIVGSDLVAGKSVVNPLEGCFPVLDELLVEGLQGLRESPSRIGIHNAVFY